MPNDPTHREDDSVAAAVDRVLGQIMATTAGEWLVVDVRRMLDAAAAAIRTELEAARREQTAARPAEVSDAVKRQEVEALMRTATFGPTPDLPPPPTPEPAPTLRWHAADCSWWECDPDTQPYPCSCGFAQTDEGRKYAYATPAPRRMMGNGMVRVQVPSNPHADEHDEDNEWCGFYACQPLPEPVESVE